MRINLEEGSDFEELLKSIRLRLAGRQVHWVEDRVSILQSPRYYILTALVWFMASGLILALSSGDTSGVTRGEGWTMMVSSASLFFITWVYPRKEQVWDGYSKYRIPFILLGLGIVIINGYLLVQFSEMYLGVLVWVGGIWLAVRLLVWFVQLFEDSDTKPDGETGFVNINTATVGELETLPGIGPETARSIIAYREAHGGFVKKKDVKQVPGIGKSKYKQIKVLITIE